MFQIHHSDHNPSPLREGQAPNYPARHHSRPTLAPELTSDPLMGLLGLKTNPLSQFTTPACASLFRATERNTGKKNVEHAKRTTRYAIPLTTCNYRSPIFPA